MLQLFGSHNHCTDLGTDATIAYQEQLKKSLVSLFQIENISRLNLYKYDVFTVALGLSHALNTWHTYTLLR